MRFSSLVLGTGILASLAGVGHAAVIPIVSDTADGNIYKRPTDSGVTDQSQGDLPVGYAYANQERVVMFVFQLPTLAVGESVTGATFKALQSASASEFNVDLYATGVRATTTYAYSTDFGVGPSPSPSPVAGTLIQDNFATPSTVNGAYVTTSSTGDAALLSYLNSNYVAGSYLFVRLNADYSTLPTNGPVYTYASVERAGGTQAPTLTLHHRHRS